MTHDSPAAGIAECPACGAVRDRSAGAAPRPQRRARHVPCAQARAGVRATDRRRSAVRSHDPQPATWLGLGSGSGSGSGSGLGLGLGSGLGLGLGLGLGSGLGLGVTDPPYRTSLVESLLALATSRSPDLVRCGAVTRCQWHPGHVRTCGMTGTSQHPAKRVHVRRARTERPCALQARTAIPPQAAAVRGCAEAARGSSLGTVGVVHGRPRWGVASR